MMIECPSCNSKEVSRLRYSKKAFVISVFLLGFPLPFIKRPYYCYDCKKEFKSSKKTSKP